ncbi:hypothetical protein ACFW1A_10340 [Kitasatospora sp. NPDC058965]|uniref:hypothetical protein n=1 Tax=Kitasatospora sp. NPDC058965 TaxID=3346682 RepID=UPI003677ACF4
MSTTVAVYAEPPRFSRAGRFRVVIDGVFVGRVRQGEAARFPVSPGRHTVRVTALDRTRSNTVTAEVAEGQEFLVSARSTGLRLAAVLPLGCCMGVPPIYGLVTALLLAVLGHALPGVLFRAGALGTPAAAEESPAPTPSAPAAPEPVSALWWENDPALAKRYRKQHS